MTAGPIPVTLDDGGVYGIYLVNGDQHCTDVTPEQGSYYRTFVMSGSAKLYNQKGELVVSYERTNLVAKRRE